MKSRGIRGRADLVALLDEFGNDGAEVLGPLLGDEAIGYYRTVSPFADSSKNDGKSGRGRSVTKENSGEQYSITGGQPLDLPFWRLEGYRPISEFEDGGLQGPGNPLLAKARVEIPMTPPECHPLVPWRELHPRLRRHLTALRIGHGIDVDLVVRELSKGRMLGNLPRLRRRRWGPHLQLIEDRSQRLIPLWEDQGRLRRRMRQILPKNMLTRAVYRDSARLVSIDPVTGQQAEYMPPPAGSLVLVMGDLGMLTGPSAFLVQWWTRFGRRLTSLGCRPLALCPYGKDCLPKCLVSTWEVISWGGRGRHMGGESFQADAERLLRLVSPAVRIEPGLMRMVRLLLGDEADVSTELEAWNHPDMVHRSSAGGTLEPERVEELRRAFREKESKELRRRVLSVIRKWRGYLPEEIWFEELLNIDDDSLTPVLAADRDAGRRYFMEFYDQMKETAGEDAGSDIEWLARIQARKSEWFFSDPVVGKFMLKTIYRLRKNEPGYQPPDALEPSMIDDGPGKEVVRVVAVQVGKELRFQKAGEFTAVGSPLGALSSQNGLLKYEVQGGEKAPGFWATGVPPTWAKRWGTDQYGAWVEFEYKTVVQRMRWIEPGEFLMGSPEGEEGRYDDEGPQHLVRLTLGYWLFDTPVTQALWEAVMGGNPSRFKSPDRPVEQVSWDDCTKFIETINREMVGLALSLPSEAQWEYSCRAGRTDALYTGSMKILGANHGPALDPIAWYGGNSGVDFELANGHDSSEWPEKQYQHTAAGTHPVKKKDPNGCGLYDMLGNVLEWCFDGKRDYSVENVEDPLGDTEPGAERVIRGGSWSVKARSCRCASRYWYHPVNRHDNIGFRCARVQVSSAGQAAGQGQPAASAMGRPVEPGRTPAEVGKRSSTIWLLDGRKNEPLVLSGDAVELRLRSDREQLILRRAVKPPWAKAMGRDRFGLWVEIEYKGVKQRMRWIPPGRFMMGSPADEPGRWSDEGPQHPVTLEKGYWLFDTTVTQGLWQAVMGKNPSEFQTENRPVETVSWDDCQEFLAEINKQVKGFNLSLPSEAQWEYACRAGSTTALYIGPIDIIGERNAPALDKIAWYGGNCGRDFELGNVYDISKWKDKQYDDPKGGTHPVAAKLPNEWGLYDMLGNVWEWCADEKHENYKGAPEDGKPWVSNEPGAERVVRGGSWLSEARYCRCAYRYWYHPDFRDVNLGFRCARVQE